MASIANKIKCIICGSSMEKSNVGSVCNVCKDKLTGKPAPKKKS